MSRWLEPTRKQCHPRLTNALNQACVLSASLQHATMAFCRIVGRSQAQFGCSDLGKAVLWFHNTQNSSNQNVSGRTFFLPRFMSSNGHTWARHCSPHHSHGRWAGTPPLSLQGHPPRHNLFCEPNGLATFKALKVLLVAKGSLEGAEKNMGLFLLRSSWVTSHSSSLS